MRLHFFIIGQEILDPASWWFQSLLSALALDHPAYFYSKLVIYWHFIVCILAGYTRCTLSIECTSNGKAILICFGRLSPTYFPSQKMLQREEFKVHIWLPGEWTMRTQCITSHIFQKKKKKFWASFEILQIRLENLPSNGIWPDQWASFVQNEAVSMGGV